jgi:hypothetical protein
MRRSHIQGWRPISACLGRTDRSILRAQPLLDLGLSKGLITYWMVCWQPPGRAMLIPLQRLFAAEAISLCVALATAFMALATTAGGVAASGVYYCQAYIPQGDCFTWTGSRAVGSFGVNNAYIPNGGAGNVCERVYIYGGGTVSGGAGATTSRPARAREATSIPTGAIHAGRPGWQQSVLGRECHRPRLPADVRMSPLRHTHQLLAKGAVIAGVAAFAAAGTAVAVSATSSDPSLTPAPVVADAGAASQSSAAFERPATASDTMPSDAKLRLSSSFGQFGPNVNQARQVTASNGDQAYLVPATDGLCASSANNVVCGTNADIAAGMRSRWICARQPCRRVKLRSSGCCQRRQPA